MPVVFGVYGRPRNQACCVLAMLFGFLTWSITHGIEVWNPTHISLLSTMQVIPSDFYGLGASVVGYCLGLKTGQTTFTKDLVSTPDSP